MTNKERIDAINRLIPAAAKLAREDLELHLANGGRRTEIRKGVLRNGGIDKYSLFSFDMFSFFFHKRMNELTRKEGLRNI